MTFKCSTCEHPLIIDEKNPPNDGDIVACQRCGKEFGSYAKIKEAALVLAEADSEGEHEAIPFMNIMDSSKN